LSFAGGNRVYIAASDEIPELKHDQRRRNSLIHFGARVGGISGYREDAAAFEGRRRQDRGTHPAGGWKRLMREWVAVTCPIWPRHCLAVARLSSGLDEAVRAQLSGVLSRWRFQPHDDVRRLMDLQAYLRCVR
jgi:hypothetical protein